MRLKHLQGFTLRATSALAMACVLSLNTMAAAVTAQHADWLTFKSDDASLVFDYPAGIFSEQQGDPTDALQNRTQERNGRTFASADGKAVLQVGTFPNLDNTKVDELRKRAIAASYADAKLDYNRIASNWYVISGTRADETFYERVHFSCNNRRLDIWSMTYPTSQAPLYDGIIEDMSRRFRSTWSNIRCS